MKKVIRLTESDLHRIVKESVSRALVELKSNNDPLDLSSNYNPYLNGDASYFNGSFYTTDGYYHVEINTSLSYVDIESEGDENYFLQGDEADELISKFCKYWSENDCTQDEAVTQILKQIL